MLRHLIVYTTTKDHHVSHPRPQANHPVATPRTNQVSRAMTRTTKLHLDYAIARLNAATNSPAASWTNAEGQYRANVGNWHYSGAYGGVVLHRISNEQGGVRSFGGYGTKRELLARINAMLDGIAAVA
jgi:hypothetical protein